MTLKSTYHHLQYRYLVYPTITPTATPRIQRMPMLLISKNKHLKSKISLVLFLPFFVLVSFIFNSLLLAFLPFILFFFFFLNVLNRVVWKLFYRSGFAVLRVTSASTLRCVQRHFRHVRLQAKTELGFYYSGLHPSCLGLFYLTINAQGRKRIE